MKRHYDFLLSEKEPFQYIEKARLMMKDGFLCSAQGKEGFKIIAPSSLLCLMLGAGTSITQEAAVFCAENDLYLSFARGGSNIHSIWHSGRYPNPDAIKNQIRKIESNRLEYAKAFLIYRMHLMDRLTEQRKNDVSQLTDIGGLLLYEARLIKGIYAEYARKNNLDFVRKFDAHKGDYVNERLNILSNAIYSICTAICYSVNISPSVAILHGEKRRGGLTFDLADLIKSQIIFDMAFNPEPIKTTTLMHNLASKLKENNQEKLKLLLRIVLSLSSDEDDLLEILKVNL